MTVQLQKAYITSLTVSIKISNTAYSSSIPPKVFDHFPRDGSSTFSIWVIQHSKSICNMSTFIVSKIICHILLVKNKITVANSKK